MTADKIASRESSLDEPSITTAIATERLLIHRLYHYCLQLLARLPGWITCHQCTQDDAKTIIRQSLVHLYMWAQGLDLLFLETKLPVHTGLQGIITSELASLVRIIQVFSNGQAKIDNQDPSLSAIDTLARAYTADTGLEDWTSDSSSDADDTETETRGDFPLSQIKSIGRGYDGAHKKHNQLVQRLGIHVRCLMDLVPTLQNYYDEQSRESLDAEAPCNIAETQSVTTIHPYIRQVQDKFGSISDELAVRLGEANWNRFQRLQRLCQQSEDGPGTSEPGFNAYTTVSVSDFRDSGLGASVPNKSHYAHSIASHTSMVSTQSSQHRGVVRVPLTPAEVDQGLPFRCPICTKTLSDIRNRVDWKLHVFADIRPYLCTVEDCNQPRTTFATRKQWAAHEFSQHRLRQVWRCFRCDKDHATDSLLLDHLNEVHPSNEVGMRAEDSSHLNGCKKFIMDVPKEQCPICGKDGYATKHEWSTHVARHMEEVALIVLPRTVNSYDDEDNDADNDASDGNNGTESTTEHIRNQNSDDEWTPARGSLVPRVGTLSYTVFWKRHQKLLSQLYREEKRTLQEVREIMLQRYNIDAPLRLYRELFRQWSWHQKVPRSTLQKTLTRADSPPAAIDEHRNAITGSSPVGAEDLIPKSPRSSSPFQSGIIGAGEKEVNQEDEKNTTNLQPRSESQVLSSRAPALGEGAQNSPETSAGTDAHTAENRVNDAADYVNCSVVEKEKMTYFRIKNSTRLGKLMLIYCDREGVDFKKDQCRFYIGTQELLEDDTANSIGMPDGAEITFTKSSRSQETNDEKIRVKIKDNQVELFFKIKRNDLLQTLQEAYCECRGKDYDSIRLYHNEVCAALDTTIDGLGISNGDLLTVRDRQEMHYVKPPSSERLLDTLSSVDGPLSLPEASYRRLPWSAMSSREPLQRALMKAQGRSLFPHEHHLDSDNPESSDTGGDLTDEDATKHSKERKTGKAQETGWDWAF